MLSLVDWCDGIRRCPEFQRVSPMGQALVNPCAIVSENTRSAVWSTVYRERAAVGQRQFNHGLE